MWKNLFYFTKREKSGLLFMMIIISVVFLGKMFLEKPKNQLAQGTEFFTDSIKPERRYNERGVPGNKTGFFENNQKTSSGNNKTQEKEKRTYFTNRQKPSRQNNDSAHNSKSILKLEVGSKVNINTADTALLMQIPGIGQAYATRILKYRNILGGYYSVEQIKEVYGMYEELYEKIIPFFEITSGSVNRIAVNKASLEKLKSHPYIDFYQAKAIVELRKKNGNIKGIEVFSVLEEFPVEELEKIKHYLSFE